MGGALSRVVAPVVEVVVGCLPSLGLAGGSGTFSGASGSREGRPHTGVAVVQGEAVFVVDRGRSRAAERVAPCLYKGMWQLCPGQRFLRSHAYARRRGAP